MLFLWPTNSVQKICSSPGKEYSLCSQLKQKSEQSRLLFHIFLLPATSPFVFYLVKYLVSCVCWIGKHSNTLKMHI